MESRDNSDTTDLVSVPAAVPQQGRTLLPAPVAHAISLATRSTSFAIRVGSFFGSYGLDAARFTTLSSLELARGMVEGVLVRAGKDVAIRPHSEFAAADAETVLERSLENLHHAVSQIVFWTSASFRFTGSTLFAASELSQLLLSSLDQLFGSTDSSRAIASIVTLIRREFNKPGSSHVSEKIGVIDLMLALSALAYLQRCCRKELENERKRQAHEEVVWDVVVVDDGERVDIPEEAVPDTPKVRSPGGDNIDSMELASPGRQVEGESPRSAPLRQARLEKLQDDEEVLEQLKDEITSSLSPGVTVSLSSLVSTTQTVTVDISGPQAAPLPTPPGAEIIEATGNKGRLEQSTNRRGDPFHRVVYKIQRNKLRNTFFHRHDDADSPVIELNSSGSEPPSSRRGSRETVSTSAPSSPTLPKKIELSPKAMESHKSPTQDARKQTISSSLRRSSSSLNVPKRASSVYNTSKPTPKPSAQTTANQKKPRSPLIKSSSRANLARTKSDAAEGKKQTVKKKPEAPETKPSEKKGGLKHVLKGSGQSISNMWNKEPTSPDEAGPSSRPKIQRKSVSGTVNAGSSAKPKSPFPQLQSPTEQRSASYSPRHLGPEFIPRSSSRQSYVSIHERRRDSIVSQTDSYSVHNSGELRPASPTVMRSEVTAHESLSRQPNDTLVSNPPSPMRSYHRRRGSPVHSLYSLATNDSQSSLVLSSYYQKSAYNTSNAVNTLRRLGAVEGTFPAAPLLHNISRYMRFSSASYGSHFLKLMGISNDMPGLRQVDETHHDVRHFVHHTDSGEGNVLLASFVDPGGGSDSTGATDTGVPLVHYISLDHQAKAVVLACRGTLGFEDVLADLTCDYDRLRWRGRAYRVHKGVHASARRILYGGDGRVLITLQEALREFPDYGLVLCGHSLGGAVTSLLGVMLSEPNPTGMGFVTTSENQSSRSAVTARTEKTNEAHVPSGRPIHVFAYGPPGTMSVSLCKITKGLITTVVHGSDLVPHLSLGLLHDFQAAGIAFKKDEHQAKTELRGRMWRAFNRNVTDRFYNQSAPIFADEGESWMMPALESLRSTMNNEKLMPPGEVFCIESQRVLRRDAFVMTNEQNIGRPAQRIVLKYVKDVKARFSEVRFGTSMLIDHSPAYYEEALNRLRRGLAV